MRWGFCCIDLQSPVRGSVYQTHLKLQYSTIKNKSPFIDFMYLLLRYFTCDIKCVDIIVFRLQITSDANIYLLSKSNILMKCLNKTWRLEYVGKSCLFAIKNSIVRVILIYWLTTLFASCFLFFFSEIIFLAKLLNTFQVLLRFRCCVWNTETCRCTEAN